MEAYELLKRLETVTAPPGFEQTVLAQLSLRKRQHIRGKTLRFSLASAFAGIVAIFLVVNFLILPGQGPSRYSALDESAVPEFRLGSGYMAGSSVPIMENVDYSSELRTLSDEMPTVYILEQVSWTTDTKIKY
jgi:hypothetical protein